MDSRETTVRFTEMLIFGNLTMDVVTAIMNTPPLRFRTFIDVANTRKVEAWGKPLRTTALAICPRGLERFGELGDQPGQQPRHRQTQSALADPIEECRIVAGLVGTARAGPWRTYHALEIRDAATDPKVA